MTTLKSELGLQLGDQILAKAFATNINGNSAVSASSISSIVVQGSPQSMITGFSIISKTLDSATFSWNLQSSLPDQGYSSIVTYVIQSNGGSGTTYSDLSPAYSSNINTATITGLSSQTDYSFKIYSTNIFGNGPILDPPVNFTTFDVPSQL
jgi:hypothetical protein